MIKSKKIRTKKQRKKALKKKLIGYSAAAGMTMAMGSTPAEAVPVFTQSGAVLDPGDFLLIDVDNDGFHDFSIYLAYTTFQTGTTTPYTTTNVQLRAGLGYAPPVYGTINPIAYNYMAGSLVTVGTQTFPPYYTYAPAIKNIAASATVDGDLFPAYPAPNSNYPLTYGYLAAYSAVNGATYRYGNFNGSGFIGIEFTNSSDGLQHYGFIWVSVPFDVSQITVHGWAWEDVAGESIHATPEPGTLATLAMGAAGLGAWRRRRKKKHAGESSEKA
ncbi:PEP-CTERM sorting domain-containing protein [Thermodesulfobacteriota bacterium]